MQNLINTKEYFIKAVSAVINETAVPALPEAVDFNKLYRMASSNAAQSILYFALKEQNVPKEYLSKLENSYKAAVIREINQQSFLSALKERFNSENIDFMLLKGSHLKALYPMPEMRFMVDMDVLVRLPDVERAKEIILSFGLEQKMNNGKDVVLIKEPFLTVELHNSLFVEDYYMYSYFSDVWSRAEHHDNSEYKMSYNDLYIYTMAHLAEHYTSAGSCFRPTIDIFLLNEKCNDKLNFDYINSEFKKINLKDFADNIKRLGEKWFKNSESDETLEIMEKYIVFGPPVSNASEASKMIDKKLSKFQLLAATLFPKMKHMKLLYPFLDRFPFLLPLTWVLRAARIVLGRTDYKKRIDKINSVNIDDTKILKDIFTKSGL